MHHQLNRREALDAIKGLPKKELFKAFMELVDSYEVYRNRYTLLKDDEWYARQSAIHYKAKYEALKPKEPPKPQPIPMDLQKVLETAVAQANGGPTLKEVKTIVPVAPIKKCFFEKFKDWFKVSYGMRKL